MKNIMVSNSKHSLGLAALLLTGTFVFTANRAAADVLFSPPSSGLIGHWKADGDATDSAGGHNGSLQGGMGFSAGIAGQAFAAGSDKRVYVPDSVDFQLSSLTIGAWVNIAANSWNVLSRGDNRSGLDPYNLALDNNGHMTFIIESAIQENDTIQAPISYGQWHQVTASLDGTTHDMRLYIDGSLVAEKTTTVIPMLALDPSETPGLGIGNAPSLYDFPLLGSIDEVLLYNRALSPTEVQTLATVPEPGIASVLGCAFGALLFRRTRKNSVK
jgi:hypothetical protein